MYSAFLIFKSECLTCNNEVLKTLGTLQGVFGAEMDRIDGRIVVNHTNEVTREEIGAKLTSLGFSVSEDSKEPPLVEEKPIETDEPSIWGCAL